MESKITDEEMRYFDEVALQLRKAGYSIPDHPPNSLLAVEWNGKPLCQVTPTGGIRYRAADVRLHNAEAAYERAFKIASTTAEYIICISRTDPTPKENAGREYGPLPPT